MQRRYRARHYEDRIRQAQALLPDAAFGADVMTGFPGETDAEFRATCELIERLPFTYLHVFTYSARPGTPAAALPQTPAAVRKERTRVLRELGARKNLEFRQRMRGRTLTTNYLSVELQRAREPGLLIEVTVGAATERGVAEASPAPAS
jgi:threonylcarbamoyladenosine tRNA methylthiotransferase MtaB